VARFCLDNDIARPTAGLLRRLGNDVVHTRDVRRTNAHDEDQLLYAARHDRVLVTHNGNDFMMLHRAWLSWSREWSVQPEHSGIVVIPQRWTAGPQAIRLDELTRRVPDLHNLLYDVSASDQWLRVE
jgi:hypothetical protein